MRGGGVRWLHLPEHWRARTAEEGCVMYIECENRTQMLYHSLNACAHTLAFFSLSRQGVRKFRRNKIAQSIHNASLLPVYAKKNPTWCWTFLGLGHGEQWYGTVSCKLEERNNTAEHMMKESAQSGHLVHRCTSSLSRGAHKSKSGGQYSIHHNAEQWRNGATARTRWTKELVTWLTKHETPDLSSARRHLLRTRTKRLENISEIERMAQVFQDAGITKIAD